MTENDIRSEWESHSSDRLHAKELDAAFKRVMDAADTREDAASGTVRRPSFACRLRVISLSVAAAVAAVVLVPWLTLEIDGYISERHQKTPVRFCEVSTHNGEMRDVVLPDGTLVKLNAGSYIVYPETFLSSERSVHICGEAIFNVTHNPEVPFVVSASDMKVTVHGTVFDVKAYPGDRSVSATLCEGSISALAGNGEEPVMMVPGQRLSFDRTTGGTSLCEVNANEYTAWERGELCFRSESIHEIARTLERMYGINIYITSGKYDGVILTAKFVHGESLRQMLGAICRLVPGMRYGIENDNVYIR